MTPGPTRGYEHFKGIAADFVSDSKPAWVERPTAPSQAPNIVVILIDDLGFSDLGPFGSEIPTPHVDALADKGWVFSNYRTAPMCSPSRASLLTGLNPHRAGFGFVAHTDPGFPGFTCELPATAPTLAESLRASGYATFMVGKWHLTKESELHDAADKSSWPVQRGFDRYFGSMDGFTSLHHPHRLVRDNSVVDRQAFPPDYFLTDELTDEAIAMIDELRVNDQSKPFLLYYAHTSVHGPIQAKASDISRHRGRYDAGWNTTREDRFIRQQEFGVVPTDATLPHNDNVPDWHSLDDDERRVFARHMEVYAAAVDEIDQSIGRIVEHLRALEELENTIIVLTSDNGGTAEGGMNGTRSYLAQFAADVPLPENWISDLPRDAELIGSPQMFNQYPAGWAQVSNTPFRDFKSSTYEGGVHAPLIISWPAAPINTRGLRKQFVSVADLAPTLLDLAGVSALSSRNGVEAVEFDGKSAAGILADEIAEGRQTQYFECLGQRAIIRGDWKAVSPVPPTKQEGAAGGNWELYHLRNDPTESANRANEHTELTSELAQHWYREAWQNTVFPLDDDGSMHYRRPSTEARLAEPVTVFPFRPPLERYRASRLTHMRSFVIEIDVTLEGDPMIATSGCAQGTIVAHGDQGGGYALSLNHGRPMLSYNAYGQMERAIGPLLAAGRYAGSLQFDEVENLHWQISLTLNNQTMLTAPAVPMLLGLAPLTGISVGYDYGGPVDWALYEKYRENHLTDATINRVRYVPGTPSTHDPTVLEQISSVTAQTTE